MTKLEFVNSRWQQEVAILNQLTAFIKDNGELLLTQPYLENALHRRINKGVNYVEVLEKKMADAKLHGGLLAV